MARTIIEAERILPYAPADLCRLVGDVRVYPEFVPFLTKMRVTKEEPLPNGGWKGVAEADVGWQAIKVTFATSVRCEPAKGEVEVALVKGPLHSLQNRWWFIPQGEGAHVRYWIAYEFKNPVLQAAISVNKDKLASRIMQAFEREARRRLA
ncbi:type II toxin-antitoxin system RatA family toxin [Terricaulis sp.]|uniref:type II toxin-antitoxin system RatA family toxin n=1 Tax=Terricaulis sp. TaxID=2768686 RepID=UPI003783C7CD